MVVVEHSSIGSNSRKVQIESEEKQQRVKEIISRFTEMPWNRYGIDQLSVWVVWFTLAASFFLFCTVSAVILAVP